MHTITYLDVADMKTVNNFVQSEKAEFSCSVRSFLPKYAMVPLCQSSEKEGSCTIIEGETVHEGDVLSKGNAFVHSSIPGSVDEIVTCTLPNGRTGKAVKIKLKGSFSYLGKKGKPQELSFMTPDYLTEKFTECGVINTFTAPAKPLCNEVKKCTAKKEKFLVVRMFDEDPSRVTDTFTAENYSSEVVTGALCIAKSFNAEGIVFVCPKKKFRMPGFSELGEFPYITVETDATKYPCGFRANLLECIKRNSKSLTSQFFSGVIINSLFVY